MNLPHTRQRRAGEEGRTDGRGALPPADGARRAGGGVLKAAARRALPLFMSLALATQGVPTGAVQAYAQASSESLAAVAGLLEGSGQNTQPQAEGELYTEEPTFESGLAQEPAAADDASGDDAAAGSGEGTAQGAPVLDDDSDDPDAGGERPGGDGSGDPDRGQGEDQDADRDPDQDQNQDQDPDQDRNLDQDPDQDRNLDQDGDQDHDPDEDQNGDEDQDQGEDQNGDEDQDQDGDQDQDADADPVYVATPPSDEALAPFAYTVLFVDNGSGRRADLAAVAAAAVPCFTLDGATYELNDETCALLGYDAPPAYTVDASLTDALTAVLTCSGLPCTVTYANAEDESDTQVKEVSWTLAVPASAFNAGIADDEADTYAYVAGTDAAAFGVDAVVRLCQRQAFTFQIKNGTDLASYVDGYDPASLREQALGYLRIAAYVGDEQLGESASLATVLAGPDAEGYGFSVSPEGDLAASDELVLSALLPLYGTQTGRLVSYAVVLDQAAYEEADPGYANDRWVASYDNSAAANHGADVTRLWAGGTMTILHEGTTSFSATKVWADPDASERPCTTFTLMRYSLGSGYATAAPVLRQDGASSGYLTYTLTEEDLENDSFVVEFCDLDRYDPDGNPYVYCLLESMDGGSYVTRYGELDPLTGAVTDDRGPTFVFSTGVAGDGEGAVYSALRDGAAFERGDDPFIYADGTATNVLTGTTTLQTPKVFQAAVYQNQIANVTCDFVVEYRTGDGEFQTLRTLDGEPVVNEALLTEDERAALSDLVVSVGGFGEETLTQTVSASLPRYDALGQTVTYRFREANVHQVFSAAEYAQAVAGDEGLAARFVLDPATGLYSFDSAFTVTDADDAVSTFELVVRDSETGATVVQEFLSTREPAQADGGALDPGIYNGQNYTLRNTVWGTTYQTVVKEWLDEDGEPLADTAGRSASFNVWNEGNLLATVTIDGDPGTEPVVTFADEAFFRDAAADPDQWEPSFADFTNSEGFWQLDVTGLPRYGSNGAAYSYLVTEAAAAGSYVSERTYDADTHTTTYVNMLGESSASLFAAAKLWVDDDDAHDDVAVVVEFYAKTDLVVGGTCYAAGEALPLTDGSGAAAGELVLNELNCWYDTARIDAPGLTADEVGVREVAVRADGADPAGLGSASAGDFWDLLAASGTDLRAAANEDSYLPVSAAGAAYSDQEGYLVSDGGHVYQASYSWNDELQAFTVTNARLGYVDLTVTKTWVDAVGPGDLLAFGDDADADEVRQALYAARPKANIELQVADASPNVRIATEKGADGADVSYVCLWAAGADPETDEPARKVPVLDAEGNPACAVQEVDTAVEAGTATAYCFYNLPKYDLEGAVIHYTAVEFWASDEDALKAEQGDYTVQRTADAYTVGALHYRDEQTVSFQNRRSATTSVSFNKEWYDQYVNEVLNKRPDLYLELFAQDTVDGLYRYPGYVAFTWKANADHETLSGVYGEGNPLPNNGAYYQTATIGGLPKYDANGARVAYWASENIVADAAALGYTDPVYLGSTLTVDRDTLEVLDAGGQAGAGSETLLAAGGTFRNGIARDLVISGTKTWQGVPAGFDAADLPDVSVTLERRVLESDGWEEVLTVSSDDGSGTFTKKSRLVWSYRVSSYVPAGQTEARALQTFDEYGRLYSYRTVEDVCGLEGTPAYDVTEEHVGQNLYEGAGANAAENSFALRNVYSSETSSLTVRKAFQNFPQVQGVQDAYPTMTFKLWRTYLRADGTYADATLAATRELTGEAFAAGTDEVTFDGLPVYAPNGSYWYYYVTEEVQNRGDADVDGYRDGYTTQVVVTYAVRQGDGTLLGTAQGDTGLAASSEGVQLVVLAPQGGELLEGYAYLDGAIEFTNVYDPDHTFSIQGTKVWVDSDNAFGTRPDELTVELYRTYDGDPDGWTLVGTQTVYAPDASSSTWGFSFTDLDVWAPNNAVYRYKVAEVLDVQANPRLAQYGATTKEFIVTARSDYIYGAASSEQSATRLKNALSLALRVTKAWDDGDDAAGLRPSQVTMELQARFTGYLVNGEQMGWTRAGTAFNLVSLGHVFDDSFGLAVLTPASATSWHPKTWNNLPRTVTGADGREYAVEYRVVEKTIGSAAAGLCVDGLQASDDGLTYEAATTAPYTVTASVKVTDRGDTVTWNVVNRLERFALGKALADNAAAGAADLAGTRFYVLGTGAEAATVYAVWTMGADGTATVQSWRAGVALEDVEAGSADLAAPDAVSSGGQVVGLAAGNYVLREVSAPAGYTRAADVAFTLGADGALVCADDAATVGDGGLLLTVTDAPIRVALKKVAQDGGEALAGAVFQIAGAAFVGHTAGYEAACADDGTLVLDGLVAGVEYTLTEVTAPQGYDLAAQPLTFTVDDRGAVTFVGDDGAGTWSLEEGAATATIVCADAATVEPEPEPEKPQPKPHPQPQPKPDPQPDPDPQPGTDPDPEPEPDEKPGTDPEPDEKPDPDPEPQPDPEPGTDPEPEPDEKPGTDPEPEPDERPGTDPEPDEKPGTDPEPDEKPDPDPGTDPEPEPDEKPGTDAGDGDGPAAGGGAGADAEEPAPDDALDADAQEPAPAPDAQGPEDGEEAGTEPGEADAAPEPEPEPAQAGGEALARTGDGTPAWPAPAAGAGALAVAAAALVLRRRGLGR